ncbi:MAG TPA: (Fe-S)-binding protein [Phycisphaerae bacterium]|nr:(Fe-S)-binding protein [Phycisphaerae bacterium]HOJ74365.1 (Fe-S)-binding protein [Phycisphaerae bacterium]HOM52989.1 (Fe-S)-binding protein [Phycisphaerae bacterium]HON68403.1 (Fe-S)-binding protein [Phycisphaerae bacterium]HOQ88013.1 (Fe-S)-binding protein [Phycisphaerae bacterium]
MRVSLFVTCLTDLYFPEVAESVVRVLHRLGIKTDFPSEQTCCGQPALNSGYLDEAAAIARRMIDVFADAETVVTPSGSCCSVVREYFPHLLRNDPVMHRRAEELAAKTFEFTEFLQKKLKVDWSAWDLPYKAVATFHYSCHNRGIGMSIEDILSLIRVFRGLEYRPLEKADQCCGFGGTFAVKFGEISGAMVQDKIACVKATGADTLICNDGGCTLNIIGALHREGVNIRTVHVATMLDQAMKAGNNRHLYARMQGEPASVPARACCCSHEAGAAHHGGRVA